VLTQAIVRTPAANFAEGLTTVTLGRPIWEKVLEQHHGYCEALRACGLRLTVLAPDENHPDSTFVEDTAVLTAHSAVLTRPGAPSREGEVALIRTPLETFFPRLHALRAPATLDGGDICEADNCFFLGLSARTNEEGVRQLAAFLAEEGYRSSVIDVRGMSSILHLKSGISYIGDHTMVVIDELAAEPSLDGYKLIRVAKEENYAANCIRVNDRVLIAAGYPKFRASLVAHGFHPLELDMSEFQKMDGGLSCLSLRF
jgi:dimethylargininase